MFARWHPVRGTLLVSGRWGGDELSLREVDASTGRSTRLEPPVVLGPIGGYGQFSVASDGHLLALTDEQAHGDLWPLEAESGTF